MSQFHSLPGNNFLPPSVCNEVFGHPDDVLEHPRLRRSEKRALLASWASDANAVAHIPTLRQLPDGSIVKVDEIIRALKAMDSVDGTVADRSHRRLWQGSFKGPRHTSFKTWLRIQRNSDDKDGDDDSAPCPVFTVGGPRGDGCGEAAIPEPVPV